MKWILFLLFTILLAFMGLLYLQDPGYVNISWIGYEIQLTAVVGVLCIAGAFLVFLFILKLFSGLLRILFGKRASYGKKTEQTLLNLLSAYEAETFSEALRLQEKASQRLKDNPFFLWISGNIFEGAEKHFDAEQSFMELAKNVP